ncbi:uncharacterized protein LOC109862028 [Pseudomyrmex gracilis]|uniref:uncharacterized protein LOC109862028 n=1 Tax=Pseudomyrmex gracilis TaxID=219809 RepID=UPI000995D76D|nr:uncharacterized protein LOC109862028 [Pseudomyrmex gracilis]XP_020297503.1 uncharacterized protein LOC109862028 [Pseudomyrmex gracilis]
MTSIQTDSVLRTKEDIPNTREKFSNIDKSQTTSKDEVYKKQVLRMLSILNYKIDQVAEDLNNLKKTNIVEKEVSIQESLFEKLVKLQKRGAVSDDFELRIYYQCRGPEICDDNPHKYNGIRC